MSFPLFKSNTSKRHILMKKSLLLSIILSILILYVFVIILKPYFIGSTKSQFLPISWNSSATNNIDKELTTIRFQNLDSLFSDLNQIIDNPEALSDIKLISRVTDSIIYIHTDNSQDNLIKFSLMLNDNNRYFHVKSSNEGTIDTLFYLYNWCNQFKTLSNINIDIKSTFYSIIYDYWMVEIVRNMEKIVESSPQLLHSVKFKALTSLCQNAQYSPNIKTSSTEKVLYNLENSRFSYIGGRFYLIFGIPGVLSSIILAILTLYSYYILFTKIKTYLKK